MDGHSEKLVSASLITLMLAASVAMLRGLFPTRSSVESETLNTRNEP